MTEGNGRHIPSMLDADIFSDTIVQLNSAVLPWTSVAVGCPLFDGGSEIWMAAGETDRLASLLRYHNDPSDPNEYRNRVTAFKYSGRVDELVLVRK